MRSSSPSRRWPAGPCRSRLAGEPPDTWRSRAAAIGLHTVSPLTAAPPLGPGSFFGVQRESRHHPADSARRRPVLPVAARSASLVAPASVSGDRMAGFRLLCQQFQAIRTDVAAAHD